MKKLKVLVLCTSNPNNDPRPNRMISWLKNDYQVTVVAGSQVSIQGVEVIGILDEELESSALYRNKIYNKLLYFLQYFLNFFTRSYEEIIWSKLGNAKQILNELSKQQFDLIVSLDCTLLPFAFELKRKTNAKILFDAREYYTRDFEEQIFWRLFRKPIFHYLCQTYLKYCDKIITVSAGLAQEYAREYKIPLPEVIMSLPYAYNLVPSKTEKENIRIIYHGAANASRLTELMIKMMDDVQSRYSLDLMLVPTSDTLYRQKLEQMVSVRKNVRIIPPVSMQEIPLFINQYDIGLFLCPPTNFNLEFVLPNKLFEYIQARLAVAIGPNIEMKKIVEQYSCGVVTEDFDPKTMAHVLNQLSTEDIFRYKNFADQAALELNADKNREKILKMLTKLFNY